jgi:hypothetical protein
MFSLRLPFDVFADIRMQSAAGVFPVPGDQAPLPA